VENPLGLDSLTLAGIHHYNGDGSIVFGDVKVLVNLYLTTFTVWQIFKTQY